MVGLDDRDNGGDMGALRKRLRRLEAVVAVLLVSPQLDFPSREGLYFLRHLFRRFSEHEGASAFDDELYSWLSYAAEQASDEQRTWQKQLSLLEKRSESNESGINALKAMFESSTEEWVAAVRSTEREARRDVNRVREQQQELQTSVHGFLAAQSMGLDLSQVPVSRIIPLRVYLSDDNKQQVRLVSAALQQLADSLGFAISDEFPDETGSWFKKWYAKSTDVLTQPEMVARLEKIERAVEIKGLHEPQADIDRKEAEAVATLLKAIENVPNAAVQAGSVLVVKVNRPDQGCCVQARTLTQSEMIHLEKNQKLLASPHDLLEKLCELSNHPARGQTERLA